MENIVNGLRDPLNETTRKTGRNLLISSTIGILITKAGLIPIKISSVGIEFSSSDINVLVIILGISILYFLMKFSISICSELQAWNLLYKSNKLEKLLDHARKKQDEFKNKNFSEKAVEVQFSLMSTHRRTLWIISIRLFVEVLIPILMSIFSICYVITFIQSVSK